MSSRNPGGETDPTVNESPDDDAAPLTDATPVDITAEATVDSGSDPHMNDAGELDPRSVDDGESRPEDAVNESG